MKERTLVSLCTFAASLAGYGYAKMQGKDATPYILTGAFLGSFIGELAAWKLTGSEKSDTRQKDKS